MQYRLGLDMGISSLGWAIVELDDKGLPIRVENMGVRKFNGGREDKTKAPLAQKRRQKRSMRRQRARFLRRQTKLLNQLTRLGLMPADMAERKLVSDCTHLSFNGIKDVKGNPYLLRARALSDVLPPYALGRVLFALNQRRGFKSNRREDKASLSKDFYEGIGKLETAIKEHAASHGGVGTLGSYFAERIRKGEGVLDQRGADEATKREGLQTTRAMYEAEFDAIREKQSASIPLEEWDSLKKTIFGQRPLKAVERGKCQLYGKHGTDDNETQRAYAADPLAQSMRIWQDINNLKVLVPSDGTFRFLTNEERQTVWQILGGKGSIAFSSLRGKLKLSADTTFNLASAKADKLIGMVTNIEMSKADHFGAKWSKLLPEQQTEVIERLQSTEEDENIIEFMVEQHGLSEEAAQTVVSSRLESGTARFGTRALTEIIDRLASRCVDVATNRYMSVTEALDELRGVQTVGVIAPRLNYYAEMMRDVGMHHNFRTVPEEHAFGIIGNPTVHIALNQLRHLVNAIIERYGPPFSIAIELARDLKLNKEQERERKATVARNTKLREEMIAECAAGGISIDPDSDDDFKKYKLWHELDEKDICNRRCIYSGQTIGIRQLFSNDIHIEHILPRSRTMDDSPANLTVAFRDVNKMKGNQTPYEHFQGRPAEYAAILDRASRLPRNKQWRFTAEAMTRLQDEEGWLSSMLNDTRYMSKIAKRYMEFICKDVRVSPGRLTAKARYQWFGKVLEKNRDEDHRHHAVDALTVALLDRRAIQLAQLAASRAEASHAYQRLLLPCPMEQAVLREQAVALVQKMIVSHRVDHGAQGPLHEETAKGMKEKEVQKFLHNAKDATPMVAIEHEQGSVQHTNVYPHGGIHHIDFWLTPKADKKGQAKKVVEGVAVYAHEAFTPKSHKQKQTRPHPTAKFLMRLHKGDAIIMDKDGQIGQLALVKQVKPSVTNQNLVYDAINQPASGKINTLGFSSLLKYNVRKVHIDILGRIKTGPRKPE